VPLSTSNDDIEEGELSEGQFEDLYEPREPYQHETTQQSTKQPQSSNVSQPESAADTPEAGFYGNDEDDEGENGEKGKGDVPFARERSGSYSPFLSPTEIQNDNSTPQSGIQAGKSASQVDASLRPANSSDKRVVVPGLQYGSQTHLSATPQSTHEASDAFAPQPPTNALGQFRSLQEAKKEAQKAILQLRAHGVKFQHYLDEGFDEAVIKGLFGDLHLDGAKSKPDQSATVSSRQAAETPQRQAASDTRQEPAPAAQKLSKGEERKDRIARLLAAKKGKAPAPPTAKPAEDKAEIAQNTPVQTENTTPAPTKPKAWGEKERLLQQKIAALQKSREAQGQKSTFSKPELKPQQSDERASQSNVPEVGAVASASLLGVSQPPKGQSITPQPASTIPGLVLSSSSANQSVNARKRPVASDFVDYSSAPLPVKRPFGADRREKSFVIDVSDNSDDEEMDMDMESPAESSSFNQSGASVQRGQSFRDFPPLTDFQTQRQFSSPVPTSHTPPIGLANGKVRKTELDQKEKEIQEMRRRIAEAEAKRKAKKSSVGSQTPNRQGQTPELKDTEGNQSHSGNQITSSRSPSSSESLSTPGKSVAAQARPPKVPDPGQQEKVERTDRVVSLDLSATEESVEEKKKMLKKILEMAERLQAEIENDSNRRSELGNKAPENSTPPRNGTNEGGFTAPSASRAEPMSTDTRATSSSEGSAPELEQARNANVALDNEKDLQKSTVQDLPAQAFQQQQQINVVAAETTRDADVEVEGAAISQAAEEAATIGNTNPSGLQSNAQDTDMTTGYTAGDGVADSGMIADVSELEFSEKSVDVNQGQVRDEGLPSPDDNTPMELESPSPSPPPAGVTSCEETDVDMTVSERASESLPGQISTTEQPRDDIQEIEAEVAGDVTNKPASQSEPVLKPYESPLRYFHAYRFHSGYSNTVRGGLKSLTYSNRIDPEKQFCPLELKNEQCPENCEFQHFKSINAPDDQILLELGKADEYSGEQKSRFIQGLRELLHDFRIRKVKDFDTIARGIIDFRARFLGDKSKVLPLDGVKL